MNGRDPAQMRANAQARLRRGMFLLPSLFTVGNIAAGYFSITETIKAITGSGDAHTHLDWAAIAIIFAIPFDALDGRIARMTNTVQRVWQGAGFAGRRHHLWRGAQPAGAHLGIPFSARFHQSAVA